MKKTLLTLLEWDIEETYRFPMFEVVIGTFLTLALALGKPVFSASVLALPYLLFRFVASIIDILIPLAMLFAAIILTNSLAGSFERGDAKLLLSYPVTRFQFVFSRVLPTFVVFVGTFMVVSTLIVGQIIPSAFFSPTFLVLLAGIVVYILYFLSVITLVSILFRSTKAASFTSILFVLVSSVGINPRIMRFSPGFLTTMVTTFDDIYYGDLVTVHSSLEIPFEPVFLAHIAVIIACVVIVWLFVSNFLEI